jgi:acyl-CoA thioesterase-2
MVFDLVEAIAVSQNLRAIGGGYECDTLKTPHGGIFGAYQLFQIVLAAELAVPDKRVFSVQTVFAHGGTSGEPAQISIETLQNGRSFAFLTVTYHQGNRIISRHEVMLTIDEPDFLHHRNAGAPPSDVSTWEELQAGLWPKVARRDPQSSVQELAVHYQLDEQPAPSLARALLALVSEPAIMASISTYSDIPASSPGRVPGNVLAQTITLLEPADLVSGVILRSTTTYAGQGRVHGNGNMVDVMGNLVATYSTSGVLRQPR